MIESLTDHSVLTEVVALRRHLHAHPELSGREFQTTRFLSGVLQQMAPDRLVEGLGGTGLAAVFEGMEAGPTVLFRAELDALPILETNDFDYRSLNRQVSHKCGHDGHMASLIGLARLMAARRPQRGRVVILLQPAEETGEGALRVLADQRFEDLKPDLAFAYHNLPGYPLGTVVTIDGAFTAEVRSLIIRLTGKTAHAAEPENGSNPAGAIAEMLQLAPEWTKADPRGEDFRLITPVFATLGEVAYGVAAGYGEVHFTIRTWNPQQMEKLATGLLAQADRIAGKYDLKVETDWTNAFKANFNDAAAVAIVREAAAELDLSQESPSVPLKWGEDFGAFTQRFPGAMFGLGAGERSPALHNPDYDFPDELLETAIGLYDRIVRKLLG